MPGGVCAASLRAQNLADNLRQIHVLIQAGEFLKVSLHSQTLADFAIFRRVRGSDDLV
jgi:hypothetical protein